MDEWIVTKGFDSGWRVTVVEDGSATMLRGHSEMPADPELGLPEIALHCDRQNLELVI